MAWQVFDPSGKIVREILEIIDNRLTIVGEVHANPNGQVACAVVGVLYIFKPTMAWFICSTAGIDAASTVWQPVYFSIAPATLSTAGIVQLASAEEVATGTNDQKACTPHSLAGAFTLLSVHNNAVAGLQAQINAIDTAPIEAVLAAATSDPTPSTLVERDINGRCRVEAAVDDGDIVNKGQMDAADTALQDLIDANSTDLANATDSADADTLVRRDSSGNISVNTATADDHPVTKLQLDTLATAAAAGDISNADAIAVNASDISDNADAISTNAGNIATNTAAIDALEAALPKTLGGAAFDDLTIATAAVTPTTGLVALSPESGVADQLDNLEVTNGIEVILVFNKDPATNTITLAHEENADDGCLVNADEADIVLDSPGQSVLYRLEAGTPNKYVEVCRMGFSSGGGGGPLPVGTPVSLTAGTVNSVAHSLGYTPSIVILVGICTTADKGYSLGEKITVGHHGYYHSVYGYNIGLTLSADATNVHAVLATSGIGVVTKGASSGYPTPITLGSWSWQFYAQ